MDVMLVTDEGKQLDAGVEVVRDVAGVTTVVLQSAGGAGPNGQKRNPDYDTALQLVVDRALAAGWTLMDVRLASRPAMKEAPDSKQRSVDLGGYPVTGDDPRRPHIRMEIGRRVERMFQGEAVKKGGNRQRRLEFDFSPPHPGRRLVADLAPAGGVQAAPSGVGDHILEVHGHLLDLDVLYRRMWDAAEPDSEGLTRTYVPSERGGRRSMKRLLAELFGVPVSDRRDAVNDACRRAVNTALSQRGWAQKVDGEGQVCEPIHRTPNYRLYPRATRATTAAPARQREYKVFRADPGRYDIDRAVAELETDWWTTAGRQVAAGDLAAIFRLQGTGEDKAERGIVAFAQVLTDPEPRTDEANPYWRSPDAGRRSEHRVQVRYVDAPRLPLLEAEDPIVAGLAASRARGGTVFYMSASEWEGLIRAAGLIPAQESGKDVADDVYEDPPKPVRRVSPRGPQSRIAAPGTLAGSDIDRRQLGAAGEDWVVARERQRLMTAGRRDLAERVHRVSQTIGDGLGYDVCSFELDDRELHIEVKTTRAGRSAPFEFSANELAVSRTDESFVLYRVYNFGAATRCWTKPGPLDESWFTAPSAYLAHPSVHRSDC